LQEATRPRPVVPIAITVCGHRPLLQTGLLLPRLPLLPWLLLLLDLVLILVLVLVLVLVLALVLATPGW
jgi:hypothetical protein